MTHHSLKIQPLPNFVSIRFSKKFPKNLARRRRVCLHFRPFLEFRPFYILDPFENLDPSTWPISLVTDGSLNGQKGSKKSDRSHIYLDNIKLHTRSIGRAAIPLFRGYVSTLSFMVHTDLFRLQILLLFILIGKACAWICSGSRNSGSKKWGGARPCLVSMNLVWWLAQQQQRSAPSREECNKYDLTIAQYFWFVHHNDSSKWFTISK